MHAELKCSRWPILKIVSEAEQRKHYDVIVLLVDPARLGDKTLQEKAASLSIPLEGFAEDERTIRIGYTPQNAKTAIIAKLAKPTRRRKNPNITSPQRLFLKLVASEIEKNAKETALIDATWIDISPEYFDAALSWLYTFDCYKPNLIHPTEIHVLQKDAEWNRTLEELNAIYRWIFFARDMVNHPPGEKFPETIARLIADHIAIHPGVSAKIITGEELRTFDLIWRVGKGVPEKLPALLRLEYQPKNAINKKPIVIIGKGVLFDQGGVTAKTNDGDLATMKLDSAGAMSAAAILAAASEFSLPIQIVAYLPLVVNMLSPNAGLPGDIGTLKDGTSVEIVDTDAEGRLILADVVSHSVLNDNPELIITLATLSGGTEAMLGDLVAGVFTDTESLSDSIKICAKYTEELIAEIPLLRDTFNDIRNNKQDSTTPADLKNYCHAWPDGDPIRAACFVLSPTFKKNIPSVHIDICGTGYLKRTRRWYPEGASGWGIRMLVEFLKRFAKERAKPSQTQTEEAMT